MDIDWKFEEEEKDMSFPLNVGDLINIKGKIEVLYKSDFLYIGISSLTERVTHIDISNGDLLFRVEGYFYWFKYNKNVIEIIQK